MTTSSITTTLPLAHKATLRIDNPAGLEITCTRGSLWLTLDGLQRDIILTAGGAEASYLASESRPALVYALADAELSVAAATARAVGTQRADVHARCANDDRATLLPLAAA